MKTHKQNFKLILKKGLYAVFLLFKNKAARNSANPQHHRSQQYVSSSAYSGRLEARSTFL
jgi:hypothetical protein